MDPLTELQRAGQIDSLTGLLTHSKFQLEIGNLVQEATLSEPVGLLMLNVLNFGAFNESYGFDAGDELLRRIAGELRTFEAPAKIVGRYGWDIFLVAWPAHSQLQGTQLVDRLSRKIARMRFCIGSASVPIGVSMGYAFAPSEAETRGDLISRCVHRCELSREQGGVPVGRDDAATLNPHGSFEGIETIVEGLLNRDPWTRIHLLHVNGIVKDWADFNLDLSESEREALLVSSLLHDVGKLLVSDHILLKPSALTAEEYGTIQKHAEFGEDILRRYERYQLVALITGQHHERWDGHGYPRGLKGNQIHPIARAISVVDAFSAMVMDRPYHCGIPEEEALAELELCAGTQFDPYFVERFAIYRREVARGTTR